MIDFLRRHIEFAFILILWVVVGVYVNDMAALLFVCGTLALFKYKGMYTEMILGFIFVLVLRDNRNWTMVWTTDTKNACIVLLSAVALFDKKQFTALNKFFLPFIPFLIYAFILTYKNPDSAKSFQKVLSYALLFTFIPQYFTKLITERGEQFFRDIVFFAVWLMCVGLLYSVFRPDLTFLLGRYNGILGNPNGVGIFCNVVLFAFYIINDKYPQIFAKPERNFIYIIIAVSLLLAGTRTGIMSALIFILFARFNKLSPFYSFSLLIIIGLSYQLLTDNLTEILHEFGLEKSLRSETIESGSGRFIAWQFAWMHIQKNFFFGMGWDYDNQLFEQYREYLNALGHNGGVHNVFLGFMLCLGVVGVALFYFGFFKTHITLSQRSRMALPFMYAVLFSTSFEAWLMGSLNPFTIFWLLAIQTINVTITSDEMSTTKI